MIASSRQWWQGLMPRERAGIAVAGRLTLAILGWLSVWRPLVNGQPAARQDHLLAVRRHAAIQQRLADREAIRRQATPGQNAAPLAERVTQLAAEAGLSGDRIDPASHDGARITIDHGRATAVLSLLHRLEAEGIMASELSLRRHGDGTVAFTAKLRRMG